MSVFQKITLIITIIGAIVWGVIGVSNFNIVNYLTMKNELANRIIYTVVGLSGLTNIALLFMKNRHHLMEE